MKIHRAPWGKALKWSSAGLVVLAVAMMACVPFLPKGVPGWASQVTLWMMPLLVLGCLPFMVRGCEITEQAILIRRPLWTTRVNLGGLKAVEFIPNAMKGSIRTCGNGGGFSFTGWYWNKALGNYRAFVTDMNRTVVLRFAHRTVVISPADPEDFVAELQLVKPTSATGDRRHDS